MNTTLLMASVYLSVFVLFVFALADTLTLDAAGPDDTVIPALNSIQIVQLGMLSLIPYWGELCLESGFITVRHSPPCSRLLCRLVLVCWFSLVRTSPRTSPQC